MFPSQPLNPTPFQKTVASRLRNRPFLYFGVPFLSIVVLASYGLQGFTKTRYDYHDTKVQTVSRSRASRLERVTRKVDTNDHQLGSCLSRLVPLHLSPYGRPTRAQITKEDELKMSKGRKKLDLREEYYVSHPLVLQPSSRLNVSPGPSRSDCKTSVSVLTNTTSSE